MDELILREYGDKFKRLKTRIDEYIASGGSIYDQRRQQPYYDTMRKLIKKIQISIDPHFSKVDAYRLCGFNFDAEYNEYADFIRDLSVYADENNYVDQIKKIKGSNSLRTRLKKLANDIKCSAADYLILMTKYRYKNILIGTDYIEQLRKELFEAYPTGDITNIKREKPQLYEKLRHVCKYCPEIGNDMQSVAEFFGLTNERFTSTNVYQHLQEKKIIQEIRKVCPDNNINELSKKNPALYFQMTKCAASHGQRISEWAENHNFEYTEGVNNSKLAKTKVDSQEREKELNKIRDKYMAIYPPTYTNGREEFHYRKKIAQLIVKELNYTSTM